MARTGGGPWKGVLWLIVIEIIICVIVALWINSGGFAMGADAHASKHEARIAEWAYRSWANHNKVNAADPVPVNDQTLTHGAEIYQAHCAVCHGGANYTTSPMGHDVYPGAPQFMRFVEYVHAHPQMTIHKPSAEQMQAREDHTYLVVKHGIRFTGMPAWNHTLSDQDIWTVAMFMQNMANLPPAVEQAWKQMPISPIAQPAPAPAAPAKKGKAPQKM